MHPLEEALPDMKESLVREAIIYPFLQRLGYGVVGPHRIRTEEPLKYSLGRKKKTDPIMKGFCDYVCEVESHGRWVVEAKGGGERLTADDAAQAHSYAHHPAVAGFFYLVTNGALFRLYDRDPLTPILEWSISTMEDNWPVILNLLGPHAIQRRALSYKIDTGKPIAQGLGSTASIVGGYLTYERHTAGNAQAAALLDKLIGVRGTFTGRGVTRTEDGLLHARVEVVGPFKEWDELNAAAGITGYDFYSAMQYISSDPDSPTILQGTTNGRIATGQSMRLPGGPLQRSPMGILMKARTEVVGFLEEDKFRGTFRVAYEHIADESQPLDLDLLTGVEREQFQLLLKVQPLHAIEALFRQLCPQILSQLRMSSEGAFEMVIR